MPIFGRMRPDIRVVADITAYAVRGVVFENIAGSPPKILKKSVYFMPHYLGEEKAIGKFREYLFSTVKAIGRVPSKVSIGLGPHFGEQEFAVWSMKKDEMPEGISAKNISKYFYRLFEKHRNPERASIAYPMELMANGYRVGNFLVQNSPAYEFDKTVAGAEEISFRAFLVSLSDWAGTQLMETRQSLGGMPVEFIPIAAAHKETFINGLKYKEGFFIGVGGEETLIILIKDGAMAGCETVPVGARHITRGISKRFSVSFQEAGDMLRQYAQGTVSPAKKTALEGHLADAVGAWGKKFSQVLDSFYASGPIPADVFLFGEGSAVPEFFSFLKRGEWMKDFSYVSSPNLRVIQPQAVFEGNTLGGALSEPADMGLAALIFYSLNHKPLL